MRRLYTKKDVLISLHCKGLVCAREENKLSVSLDVLTGFGRHSHKKCNRISYRSRTAVHVILLPGADTMAAKAKKRNQHKAASSLLFCLAVHTSGRMFPSVWQTISLKSKIAIGEMMRSTEEDILIGILIIMIILIIIISIMICCCCVFFYFFS